MDIKELFKGVAVVIDDEINDDKKDIFKIVEQLENENIPLLKYKDIPDEETIINFSNVSFILLDWELFKKPEGVRIKEELFLQNNIDFIQRIKKVTFAPIFIFSHLDPSGIIEKLVDAGLYERDKSNYIFVKKKDELIGDDKLFAAIEEWLKQTPSIYALKEWEKSLNEAKTKLFWDFYGINHKWPSVLQKTFTEDGSDVNYELGNFIFKNIMARTEPIQFDEEILKIEDDDLTQADLRKVLEAERFLKNTSLSPNTPMSGDLFEFFQYEIDGGNKEKKKYFINIRPDCDIIRDKDNIKKGEKALKNSESAYNPHLYCLECEIIKNKDVELDKGSIIERKNSSIVPFVFGGKIIKINFDKIFIFKWNEQLQIKDGKSQRIVKDTRIGRILPPYITAIQQKYSFYLQRQGLPAIPEKAIKDN